MSRSSVIEPRKRTEPTQGEKQRAAVRAAKRVTNYEKGLAVIARAAAGDPTLLRTIETEGLPGMSRRDAVAIYEDELTRHPLPNRRERRQRRQQVMRRMALDTIERDAAGYHAQPRFTGLRAHMHRRNLEIHQQGMVLAAKLIASEEAHEQFIAATAA